MPLIRCGVGSRASRAARLAARARRPAREQRARSGGGRGQRRRVRGARGGRRARHDAREELVTENASCDKTNNGGLREGIARARGFGPGEGVERRDEVTEKGSAHLEGVAYHVVCAVRRVRCAFQTPRQHRQKALFEIQRCPGQREKARVGSRRDFFFSSSALIVFPCGSDLLERQTRGRETLPGVSGATAGVGCVRDDEPAEQGAEG